MNNQDVTILDLEKRLRDIYEQRKEKTLFLAGAESLRYKDIIEVIDAAKGAGVDKIGIVTEGMRRAAGVSTGKADFQFDLIASKEAARVVEVSGFAGYEVRGNPDGFDLPTGAVRWGAGAAFPSRSPLRGVL